MKYLVIRENSEGRCCGWGQSDDLKAAMTEADRQYDHHCCYPGESKGRLSVRVLGPDGHAMARDLGRLIRLEIEQGGDLVGLARRLGIDLCQVPAEADDTAPCACGHSLHDHGFVDPHQDSGCWECDCSVFRHAEEDDDRELGDPNEKIERYEQSLDRG